MFIWLIDGIIELFSLALTEWESDVYVYFVDCKCSVSMGVLTGIYCAARSLLGWYLLVVVR